MNFRNFIQYKVSWDSSQSYINHFIVDNALTAVSYSILYKIIPSKIYCELFTDESQPTRSSRKKRGKTSEQTMDTGAPASQSAGDIDEEK